MTCKTCNDTGQEYMTDWDRSVSCHKCSERCPACNMDTVEKVRYSMSRYMEGVKICSPCGRREAFEGFFWAKVNW